MGAFMQQEFSENIHLLEKNDQKIYLIGTAHVSQKSVDEVRETIQKLKPDTVCVELCETRYQSMMDEDRWKKLDIFEIIKQKKVLYLLSSLAIGAFQRRIGEKLGTSPGAEFKAAIEEAKKINAKIVLADRDVQATLKRTWRNLNIFKKVGLFNTILESLFSKEEIQEEDIEKMKENDQLNEMMQEFAKMNPEIQKPLIDERDQYLMSSTEEEEGKIIVSVVGAGHIPGMKTYFGKKIDRENISKIPEASKWLGLLKWIIPSLVLLAFYIGIQKNSWDSFDNMLYAWVLPNSILAALLTAIAGGKIISIVVAFIASPITSLNPLLPAGIVVGLTEAYFRKPTVEDCENIPKDVQDIKGIYKNKFTRVLLVAFLASIGSALGAYVGISWLAWMVTS
jgi:pheromone shutdown-related protein TraB